MRHNTRTAIAQSLGMFIVVGFAIWFLFFAMPAFFKVIDCSTATRNLAFIERCTDNEHCTLTAKELGSMEAYTRLQIRSCPQGD